MVESLRRSVARLEPPLCSHCHVKMIWYRSMRAAEHGTIVHYFQCANCSRIEEKTTKIKTNGEGKAQLSSAPHASAIAARSSARHRAPAQLR